MGESTATKRAKRAADPGKGPLTPPGTFFSKPTCMAVVGSAIITKVPISSIPKRSHPLDFCDVCRMGRWKR